MDLRQERSYFLLRELIDRMGYKVITCKSCNGRHHSPIPSRRPTKDCDSCKNNGVVLQGKLDKL